MDQPDRAEVEFVARRTLGDPRGELVDWAAAPIPYKNMRPGLHGVQRVRGMVRSGGAVAPWSAVLKTLDRPPWAVGQDGCPPHGHCWFREVLAYRAGLLDDLVGVRAPRCYAVVDASGGGYRLWLEELVEATGEWPLERYGLAARHFGRFAAAYLLGRSIPARPWLSRARLGPSGALTGTPGRALEAAGRAETWEHPLVRRFFAADAAARVRRLAAAHDALYERLQALPPVLCHWDAFRDNLFSVRRADGVDETVAIDWSCMGRGAVGEELVPFVVVTLCWFDVPATEARDLAEVCLAGYARGLADDGWRGDPALVRGAFAASLARWLPLAAGLHLLPAPDAAQYVARVWGRTLEEAAAQWSGAARALVPLAEGAL